MLLLCIFAMPPVTFNLFSWLDLFYSQRYELSNILFQNHLSKSNSWHRFWVSIVSYGFSWNIADFTVKWFGDGWKCLSQAASSQKINDGRNGKIEIWTCMYKNQMLNDFVSESQRVPLLIQCCIKSLAHIPLASNVSKRSSSWEL